MMKVSGWILWVCVVAGLMSIGHGGVAAAAPAEQSVDEASLEQQLAERFAPILMLKTQDAPCDADGEPYRPGSVDVILNNPEVALRQVGRDDPVVMRAPGAADLYELGGGFFLDFPGSSLTPGCIYEQDFWKYTADRPATVYAHVVQQPDEPDLVFVQYWFYWYYNDWNNKHESDWEGITLKFEASGVAEALNTEPVAVGYSQHEGGERADWNADKLERDGDHPVVYPSAGSHASYYSSALYLGRAASEGFGCDNTSGPSNRVVPEVIVLPDAVDSPDDPLAWLAYNGRWGERQSGAFNGPTGPAAKARWLEPAPWFEELRAGSVHIPSGDSQASSVISLFCGVVEAGSGVVTSLTVDPTGVFLALGIMAVVLWFVARRTAWGAVDVLTIRCRRRAGQILSTMRVIVGSTPLAIATFGLLYVPAAVIAGLLGAIAARLPFIGTLISVAGNGSGTTAALALSTGGISSLVAFTAVSASVAIYLDGNDRGVGPAIAAMRSAWDLRTALLGPLLRTTLVVGVLFITVIGAPFGVLYLVRYQFATQVVALEGVRGAAALQRSAALVKGRWLHTALVAAVVNGVVLFSGLFVALLLLIIVSGLPLWAFSGLVTLVFALGVPFVAVAMTLLYGDAVTEHESESTVDAELVDI